MAELGQTTDPRALVPGTPDALEDGAATLRKHGEHLESVGSSLEKIDFGGWMGQAADAFREKFAEEPPKWLKTCDLLDATAKTLTGYADTLRWAQSEASAACPRTR